MLLVNSLADFRSNAREIKHVLTDVYFQNLVLMVVFKIYTFELHIFVALLHYNADRIHVSTTAYVIHRMHVFGRA